MKLKSNSGFTLVEIVISLTILATLTVFSTMNIQAALRAKAKVSEQVEDMGKVRDALRILERDINLAYHYRDIEMEFKAEVACRSRTTQQQQQQQQPIPGVPAPPTAPPGAGAAGATQACLDSYAQDPKIKESNRTRLDPTTQFVGKENKMDFATMNTGRVSVTEQMADFAKVGYALKKCNNLDGSSTGSGECLVRRYSTVVEGDITKGGEDTVLLQDVTEFKLRYIGPGKQDWNSAWSSVEGDAATKDNYPSAVEISLTIEVKRNEKVKAKKISMQIVSPIHFPNNKPRTSGGSNPSAIPGQPAGAPGLTGG